MKLVMVTTSQSHWDGLAGTTAMFSEAVVQHAILDALPNEAVETIFIKKNPQTRRFEKAWKGKTKNFKKENRQDKDYIVFEVEGLQPFNCPEVLRTKTVGCYLLTENIEPAQEAPRRPMAPSREKEERTPITEKRRPADNSAAFSAPTRMERAAPVVEINEAPVHLNGNGKYPEQEITVDIYQPAPTIVAGPQPIVPENGADDTSPAFFRSILSSKSPAEFEQYCFYLLRLLGIHDLHRPANFAGNDAHGFFKFNTLSVVYTCTLVPAVLQENPLVIDYYLNTLKKEKIRLAQTSYTLKDTQKQVWILCNNCNEVQHLRTDDGIKLKLVPVSALIALYNKRLVNADLNTDSFWDVLKNL